MPSIFGRSFGREELRRLVGGMAQLAGIRLVDLADGRVRGMRAAEVFTGSGFRFQVLVDRGLDLGCAEHAGRPLAWVHPALGSTSLREPHGIGWLRTFGGGLVSTCGLDHFGPPDPEGEGYGLHGRASHLPAENLRLRQEWRGDEYVLEIEGETRQARLFGENLRLERRVSTRLGAASVVIDDRVTNEGFRPTPLAVLYHCNFGFPAVSPDSELLVRDLSVRPRDEAASAGLADHRRFGPPQEAFAEQVFFHEPRADAAGFASAAIVNHPLGFGAFVRWRAAELPVLTQWKMTGEGEYVCGLEPSTHAIAPTRREQRENGSLRDLAPGESVSLRLEIGALPDEASIAALETTLAR
jgi:galactose mutarotase-like enzyme